MHEVAGVLGLVVGAASGALVPWMVRSVPEPDDAEEGKASYVSLSQLPRLRVTSVVGGALLLGSFAAALGPTWALLLVAPWVPLGIALSVIDWHTHRLPTYLLRPAYPATAVLLLVCAALGRDWEDLRRAALGWLVVGGYYFVLNFLGPRLVGYGDVRLAGLLGPVLGFLGWGPLVLGVVAPMLAHSLVGLALVLWHRSLRQLKRRVPFGPTMLGGAALGVVAGAAVADWYLRSTGLA